MQAIKNITIIGTGVIGASWTAFYLSKGFTVTAYDPAPNAKENLFKSVAIYLNDLAETHPDYIKNLYFSENLSTAVKEADFIQENGPERLEIKKELYHQITAYCPPQTIIASSSSGLKISDIQEGCQHPERILLGHPFNPPHLLPLVEIVGGKKTSPSVIQMAFDFYQTLGKKPILIHKEVALLHKRSLNTL